MVRIWVQPHEMRDAICPEPILIRIGRPILHTIHSPTRLSHIGISPPQAYPQITPPSPVGGPKSGPKTYANQALKSTPIRPSNVFLSAK
jgi:hypothetical protein